ncbi:MAG: hypothetical protein IPG33_10410 [Betaproteobacteria bacterium]|nr:hypothetical protein [Betaproteobacteria bacterium]
MRVARGFDILRSVAEAPRDGLSAAGLKLRQRAVELIRVEQLAEAAYSYDIVSLDVPAAETLYAHGEALYAPRLLPESGQLTALACAVCTLGPALETRISSLFTERHASLAMALDSLGNELLMAVSRRAQDRMLADARRRGLTMAGELRAGDPGLALDTQAAVLRLAQSELIGVRLTGGLLMRPLKSVSMVLGVGIDLPPVQWSRCDGCRHRVKCNAHSRPNLVN